METRHVSARACLKSLSEVVAKILGASKAAVGRYILNGACSGFQQLLRPRQSLLQHPIRRCRASCSFEAPQKSSFAHTCFRRQLRHSLAFEESLAHRIEQGTKPASLTGRRDSAFDVLRLTALAMRWQNKPARYIVGDLRTKILSDYVKTQVDTSGATG
jgi:hypothetical protein